MPPNMYSAASDKTASPGVAPEGAEVTPELIKRLAEYARDYATAHPELKV